MNFMFSGLLRRFYSWKTKWVRWRLLKSLIAEPKYCLKLVASQKKRHLNSEMTLSTQALQRDTSRFPASQLSLLSKESSYTRALLSLRVQPSRCDSCLGKLVSFSESPNSGFPSQMRSSVINCRLSNSFIRVAHPTRSFVRTLGTSSGGTKTNFTRYKSWKSEDSSTVMAV